MKIVDDVFDYAVVIGLIVQAEKQKFNKNLKDYQTIQNFITECNAQFYSAQQACAECGIESKCANACDANCHLFGAKQACNKLQKCKNELELAKSKLENNMGKMARMICHARYGR